MCKSTSGALLSAIILATLSTTLFAQQTGTITGTVSDTSAAVVPNAKVKLTNSATQDVRHSVSNGEGFFSFNAVVTGSYVLTVEANGFKTEVRAGITLSPGDRRDFNIELAVGSETERVNVEAYSSQVQVVQSGERSSVLSSGDIRNLALQGRDVTELTKTLPGFNNLTNMGGIGNFSGYDPSITSIGSSVGNGYSANGTPNRSGTALTSDGANVIDPGCNCNATQTINADMVDEVKVSTSAYGADNPKGPVVIQAVGKSGSVEYHGGAYLHFRNSALNSTDWDTAYNGVSKPIDHSWYPGGNIGGPIPYTHKKAVFWSGYENYRQSFPDQVTHGVVTATVPTMSMRSGNFDPNAADNQALCGLGGWMPQCGGITSITPHGTGSSVAVANNNIGSYIDPGGAAIMREIVLPNYTPTASRPYNFVKGAMQSDNGYMFHSRVDYNFNDSMKLYVSYNQQRDDSNIPVMLWWAPPNEEPFPGGFVAGGDSRTVSGTLVKVFSPTLTNEFIGSFSYLNATKTYSNPDGVSRQALQYPYKGIFAASKYMPMLSTGWWIPGYPMIYQQDADGYYAKKTIPAFSDNLTKVRGSHTFKVGVNWEKIANKEYQIAEQNGNYQFATWGASGNPVANILLGVPTYYEESSPNTYVDVGYKSLGTFAQDDWKVTKRLTVNLGIRFSHDPAWTDLTGRAGIATWTKAAYQQDVAAGISTLPGMRWNSMNKSTPVSGRTAKSVFVSPRFGVAYDLFGNGRTLLRGGWGTYYYHDSIGVATGANSTALGSKMCKVNTSTWLGDIDKGVNVNCAAVLGTTAVNPNDDKEPVTYTYNFTISQRTIWNSLLEVAYSGNHSVNMISPLSNVNAIPAGAFFGKNPVTGQVETTANIESGKRTDASGNTVYLSGDQYRPMQQYSTLSIQDHGAWANYNSLQVSWNKLQGAVTYGLNYTFSKALGIFGTPDPVNMNNDYGVVSMDRTHVLNATFSYEVKTHLKGPAGGFVNGWLISNITSVQSGPNMAASASSNYNIGGASGDTYPNLHVDATSIVGSSDYSLMPTILCNPSKTTGNGSYFNPSCFGVPAIGSNGPYESPYVHAPMYWNSDIRVGKTFKIGEHHRVQFNAAAFNFINHHLTSFDPNSTSNRQLTFRPTNGSLSDYTNYNGPYTLVQPSGNIVTGTPNIKFGRRVVELSLKYEF